MAFQAVQRLYGFSLGKILVVATGSKSLSNALTLFIKQRGSGVRITGEIMMEIGYNLEACKAIAQLLKEYDGEIRITEAAMQNFVLSDIEVVMVLLGQMAAEFKITKEMLEQAARNGTPAVKVTEQLIERISSVFDNDMMMLLLDRYGMAVEITEKVVETIVRNCGWEVVMRLLKSKGAEVEIARWSIGSCSRRGRGEWG